MRAAAGACRAVHRRPRRREQQGLRRMRAAGVAWREVMGSWRTTKATVAITLAATQHSADGTPCLSRAASAPCCMYQAILCCSSCPAASAHPDTATHRHQHRHLHQAHLALQLRLPQHQRCPCPCAAPASPAQTPACACPSGCTAAGFWQAGHPCPPCHSPGRSPPGSVAG